jgi:hypothetical protein
MRAALRDDVEEFDRVRVRVLQGHVVELYRLLHVLPEVRVRVLREEVHRGGKYADCAATLPEGRKGQRGCDLAGHAPAHTHVHTRERERERESEY